MFFHVMFPRESSLKLPHRDGVKPLFTITVAVGLGNSGVVPMAARRHCGKPLRLPAIVPKLSDTPGDTKWVGPALGEHTAEVLGALGYSSADQRELKRKGVI